MEPSGLRIKKEPEDHEEYGTGNPSGDTHTPVATVKTEPAWETEADNVAVVPDSTVMSASQSLLQSVSKFVADSAGADHPVTSLPPSLSGITPVRSIPPSAVTGEISQKRLNFVLQISGGGLRLAPLSAGSSQSTRPVEAAKANRSDGQLFFVKNTASGEPQLYMAFSSQPKKLYLLQPSAGHQLNVKVNAREKSTAGAVSRSGSSPELPQPATTVGGPSCATKQVMVMKSPATIAGGVSSASSHQALVTDSGIGSLLRLKREAADKVGKNVTHKLLGNTYSQSLPGRSTGSLLGDLFSDALKSASPPASLEALHAFRTKTCGKNSENLASNLRNRKRASATEIICKQKPKAASLLTSALSKCSQSSEVESSYGHTAHHSQIDDATNIKGEVQDTGSEESAFPFKIDSVFSLAATNDLPSDFFAEEGESGFTETKAIKAEDFYKTRKYTQEELVDMCGSSFVVIERLSQRQIDSKGVAESRSRCSEYCRKRTLNYLCILDLIRCQSAKKRRIKFEESSTDSSVSTQEDGSSTDTGDCQASSGDAPAAVQPTDAQLSEIEEVSQLPKLPCDSGYPLQDTDSRSVDQNTCQTTAGSVGFLKSSGVKSETAVLSMPTALPCSVSSEESFHRETSTSSDLSAISASCQSAETVDENRNTSLKEKAVVQEVVASLTECQSTDNMFTSKDTIYDKQGSSLLETQTMGPEKGTACVRKSDALLVASTLGTLPIDSAPERGTAPAGLDTRTTNVFAETALRKENQEVTDKGKTVNESHQPFNRTPVVEHTRPLMPANHKTPDATNVSAAGNALAAPSQGVTNLRPLLVAALTSATATPLVSTFLVGNNLVVRPPLTAATRLQTTLSASLSSGSAATEIKPSDARVTPKPVVFPPATLDSGMGKSVQPVTAGGTGLTGVPALQPTALGPLIVVVNSSGVVMTTSTSVTATPATSSAAHMNSLYTGLQPLQARKVPIQATANSLPKTQCITVASKSPSVKIPLPGVTECSVVTLTSAVASKPTPTSSIVTSSSTKVQMANSSSASNKIVKIVQPVQSGEGKPHLLASAKASKIAVKINPELRPNLVSKLGDAPCSQKMSSDMKEPRTFVKLVKVASGPAAKPVPAAASATADPASATAAPASVTAAPVTDVIVPPKSQGQAVAHGGPPTARVILVPVSAASTTSIRQPLSSSVSHAATMSLPLAPMGLKPLVPVAKPPNPTTSISPSPTLPPCVGKSLIVPSRFQTPTSSSSSILSSKSLSLVSTATKRSTASTSQVKTPLNTGIQATSPVTVIIRPPPSGSTQAITVPKAAVIPRPGPDSMVSDSKQPYLKIIMPSSGSPGVVKSTTTVSTASPSITSKTVASDTAKSQIAGIVLVTPAASQRSNTISTSPSVRSTGLQAQSGTHGLSASQSLAANDAQIAGLIVCNVSSSHSSAVQSMKTSATALVEPTGTVSGESASKRARIPSLDNGLESAQNKRARLERKYPLPPGVVIKTEPETFGYPSDTTPDDSLQQSSSSFELDKDTSYVPGTQQLLDPVQVAEAAGAPETDEGCEDQERSLVNEPDSVDSRPVVRIVDSPVGFQLADPTSDSEEEEPPADLECPDLEASVSTGQTSEYDAPPVLTPVSPLPIRHGASSRSSGQDLVDVYGATSTSVSSSSSRLLRKLSTSSKGKSNTVGSRKSRRKTKEVSAKASRTLYENIEDSPTFSDANDEQTSDVGGVEPSTSSSRSYGFPAPSTSSEDQTPASLSSSDRIRQLKEMLKQQNEELERIRRQRASQPSAVFNIDD